MAKKKSNPVTDLAKIIPAPATPQPITETIEKNYMPYVMSVIISRAIPEIDGLKPSHRKLLYTMYKMGLLTGGRTKSTNVVGQTMKLHPHGDAAIYETMVRLTRGYDALLHPLVDSKGSFGKQYSSDMKYVFTKEGAQSLGGFGAIAQMFPTKWDWRVFWETTAFLSVVLAFMNVLPIPGLDGGHILFLLVEVISGRKPSDKFLEKAQTIGMILLFALLIYANGNDIIRWLFK